MDYRGLIVLSACLAAGMVPLLPACKGPDPGAISFEERPTSSSGDNETSSSGGSSGAATTDGGGTTTDSGGATGGDAVFKTEAFKAGTAEQIVNDQTHGAETKPMEGKECGKGGCHGDPGAAGPKWAAGGTVYNTINGGKLDAALKDKVEIRIIKPDGTEVGTFYPDADGNFYCSITDPLPDGCKVAIRTDTTPAKVMSATIGGATGSNCNSAACHGAAANRIYPK
jgi:hypothetical protein